MKICGDKKARVKADIYLNQDGLCVYCGKDMSLESSTIDHLIPLAKGGTWAKANLVLSHKACNTLKGTVIIPKHILNNKPMLYDIFRNKQIQRIK